MKQELQNSIRINHRGFLSKGQKRFILTENKADSDTFSVFTVDNVKEILVYTGKLTSVCEDDKTYFIGDFSTVTKNGDYFIEAGGFRSRQFVIYDGAYDICQRIMLEYFTYQRCGHPLGWNGACHKDDGYIKETGEHIDLNGGYHQSCDLRKSPGGVSIGVLSMLRFALKDKSEWGKILVYDEAKWALEYYIKQIQENGAMYNTLNDPFGWEGRIFYKSPAPSSSQWNVTSILALGYIYFKEKDLSFAERCLDKALLSFEFMTSDKRPTGVYAHPDKYQMGMDPDFFYEQCRKGSTADIAFQISVCADLYKATGKEQFLTHIKEYLPILLNQISQGYVLRRIDESEKTVSASCSYTWLCGGLLALCNAYEVIGDTYSLKEKIKEGLDAICDFADKSVWRILDKIYSDKDLDVIDGHENKTRRQMIGALHKHGSYYYPQKKEFQPSYACYLGIFLAWGGKIVKDNKYRYYAQSVVDYLLGANPLDSSHIHAVGYNHCQHISYGQFFPSTPFIPGAVGVGYSSIDVYSSSAEFDMPCVGLSMHLISELTN